MIERVEKKDGSVVWRARFGHGAPLQTFKRKSDAEAYVSTQQRNRQLEKAGMPVPQPAVTFAELATIWKANFDPSAWRLSMLKHAEDRWGDRPVKSIRPQEVGAWLHGLDYSGKTKKHILETLRQVFNAAVEWDYLTRSPARPGAFKAPSESRKRPILPFESWAEVERVAAAAGWYGPLVLFVCSTGLRMPSEVLRVQWRDVNREERLLTVHGTKTANAARTIPLSQRAMEALEKMPKRLGPVFTKPSGQPVDYRAFARYEWRRALEQATVPYRTPYEMRHSFATLALEAGAHIEDVSQVLGHANIDITRRYYAKWTRPRLERFRLVLDGVVS